MSDTDPHVILYFILVHSIINIWLGKCARTVDEIATRKQILHSLAASYMQSHQFFHAVRTLILIKKWRHHIKILHDKYAC
jgi:hypothetical protein